MTLCKYRGEALKRYSEPLSKAHRLLLGEGPGNIGPYSEFDTLICTLEGVKVSQCPVFPTLYTAIAVGPAPPIR